MTATNGGLTGTVHAGRGNTLVYGLAPDSNRFVSIVLVSGKVVHAQVIHNVYVAIAHGPIQSLIVKTTTGKPIRSPDLHVPISAGRRLHARHLQAGA